MKPDTNRRTESLAILRKCAEVEVLVAQGFKVYRACEEVKIARPTFYENRAKAKALLNQEGAA